MASGEADSRRPTAAAEVADQDHPLWPALRLAKNRYRYISRHVRDYTCLIRKRERIDGELQEMHFLRAEVRRESPGGEQPYSVFLRFLSPARVADRRVVYVEGENEGKMLVRNGGPRFDYLRFRVAPDSRAAHRESNFPITDLGFDRVVARMIEQLEDDLRIDAAGTNTRVEFFSDVQVNQRPCLQVRVVHPRPQEGIQFYAASVYVDQELHVPIRIVGYDWPKQPGEDLPLLEEYTYLELKVNVGLDDDRFRESRLD